MTDNELALIEQANKNTTTMDAILTGALGETGCLFMRMLARASIRYPFLKREQLIDVVSGCLVNHGFDLNAASNHETAKEMRTYFESPQFNADLETMSGCSVSIRCGSADH